MLHSRLAVAGWAVTRYKVCYGCGTAHFACNKGVLHMVFVCHGPSTATGLHREVVNTPLPACASSGHAHGQA